MLPVAPAAPVTVPGPGSDPLNQPGRASRARSWRPKRAYWTAADGRRARKPCARRRPWMLARGGGDVGARSRTAHAWRASRPSKKLETGNLTAPSTRGLLTRSRTRSLQRPNDKHYKQRRQGRLRHSHARAEAKVTTPQWQTMCDSTPWFHPNPPTQMLHPPGLESKRLVWNPTAGCKEGRGLKIIQACQAGLRNRSQA